MCLGCPRPLIRGWPEQKLSVTQSHHKGDSFWGTHWTYLPKISCQEMAWGTSSPALDEGVCTSHHCSVTKLCLTIWEPMDYRMPGFPVLHYLPELAQTHVHWVSDAIQPSHPLSPLLLLPSIFPRIRVFLNESALPISWPKYWSFSFSMSLSKGYSELISFRIDWFDLLTVQGTLKSSPAPQF